MKLRPLLIALIASCASPVMAASPRQFDLSCDVQRHWRDGTNAVEPVAVRIRVDLDQRRWCDDDCPTTFEIDEVSDNFVRFKNLVSLIYENDNSGATPTKWEILVARDNGTYADVMWHPFERSYWSGGKCEVVPFSGFPVPKERLF